MAIVVITAVLLLASSPAAAAPAADAVLMVPLTLIPLQPQDSSTAVCLDGTPPGYHLHKGWGSGAHSWVVHLEGGGWCNTVRSCVFRKTTRRGSSSLMEKQLPFTGILSNDPQRNPDFFNWNRLKLRYCDGASFAGDSSSEEPLLHFRGRRIWEAAMRHLVVEKGMADAQQALLSGCSAGGLAAIIHCDDFRGMFPPATTVKCLSDAGLFLDASDVSGGHTLRDLYSGVVSLQQVRAPPGCTPAREGDCFFPQNLIGRVRAPLFLLNSAYDAWQLQASLAPPSADPTGSWAQCKLNHAHCNSSQMRFLQGFRDQMVGAVKAFALSPRNGLFINSCFAHCQSERQDTWFAPDSPLLGNKPVAVSVGDWYFDRAPVKAIDCPYPCDNTCHNLVFNKKDSSSVEYSDSPSATTSEGFFYISYSAASLSIVTTIPLILQFYAVLCVGFNALL